MARKTSTARLARVARLDRLDRLDRLATAGLAAAQTQWRKLAMRCSQRVAQKAGAVPISRLAAAQATPRAQRRKPAVRRAVAEVRRRCSSRALRGSCRRGLLIAVF